ncbi:MAG: hypothetical protein HOP29_16205 [Phycisphaerales bacterium]|nr:hypothetical protein [Phycisphaerales bacterium]
MKTRMVKTSAAAAMALVMSAGFVYGNPPIGFYEGPGEVALEENGVLTVLAGEVGATRVGVEFDVTALMTADSLHGEKERIAYVGWLTIVPADDNGIDVFVDPMEPEAPKDWIPPDWALDGPGDVTNSLSWNEYLHGLDVDRAAWLAARTPFRASLVMQNGDDRARIRPAQQEPSLRLGDVLTSVNQRRQAGFGGGNGGGIMPGEVGPSTASNTVKECPGGYCKCTVGDLVGEACCPKGFMPRCTCAGPVGSLPATAKGDCIQVQKSLVGDGDMP